ncbi:unnamed protein product [Peniophora sp. CBMAI 1063]|nr:unnamed protein product [Peniophora sp. CBMAI 1063]
MEVDFRRRGVSTTGNYYAQALPLVPALELETVLYGVSTTALAIFFYKELREGIRALAKRRLLGLIVVIALYAMLTAHWALSVQQTSRLLFSGLDVNYANVSVPDAFLFHTVFGPFLLETGLFGTFTTLAVYAVYTFTTQENGLARPAQSAMMAVTLVMYSISLAHWSLQVRMINGNYTTYLGAGAHFVDPRIVPLALISVNIILGDGIVLWRACVFWRRNRLVYALSIGLFVFIVGLNIANVVVEAAFMAEPDKNVRWMNEAWTQPAFSDSAYGAAALALSLATNAASTIAIGWKTWIHRRKVLRYLTEFSPRSIVDKVLTLLWESGCIYCITWILYIVSNKLALSAPSPVGVGTIALGVDYFNRLMAQLTGIYPTLVLVLVALERKHLESATVGPSISSMIHDSPQSRERMNGLSHRTALRRPSFSSSGAITSGGGLVADKAEWECDVERAGSAFAMPGVEDHDSPMAFLPIARTAKRESVLAVDRSVAPTSSAGSVGRLYRTAARFLERDLHVECKPSPPILPKHTLDDARWPTHASLPPSRRPTRSTTEDSLAEATPEEMRSTTIHDHRATEASAL